VTLPSFDLLVYKAIAARDLFRQIAYMIAHNDQHSIFVHLARHDKQSESHFVLTLPQERKPRETALESLALVMAYEDIHGFFIAGTVFDPDKVTSIGVCGEGATGCFMQFNRTPLALCSENFTGLGWFDPDQIDSRYNRLFQRAKAPLTEAGRAKASALTSQPRSCLIDCGIGKPILAQKI